MLNIFAYFFLNMRTFEILNLDEVQLEPASGQLRIQRNTLSLTRSPFLMLSPSTSCSKQSWLLIYVQICS